mmetsp:Transcript_14966/g.34583  ORF Transcript_14966/g.34583 Transcript_14966/m.34583 type:complete len:82 (+) Transcript_14966:2199-2444(+)
MSGSLETTTNELVELSREPTLGSRIRASCALVLVIPTREDAPKEYASTREGDEERSDALAEKRCTRWLLCWTQDLAAIRAT